MYVHIYRIDILEFFFPVFICLIVCGLCNITIIAENMKLFQNLDILNFSFVSKPNQVSTVQMCTSYRLPRDHLEN